jgi:hypothetical protein
VLTVMSGSDTHMINLWNLNIICHFIASGIILLLLLLIISKVRYCWGPSASEGPQKHDLTVFLEYNV